MKIAALFPGQGSQHSGMGKFLCDEFKLARQTFEEASDAISVDMKKLCFDAAESDLALTHNTQPALLLVSVATYRVLSSLAPFSVTAGAGHSVGEYAAIVCAGAIDFASGLKSVRLRGEAMQSAVPVGQGGMAAVMGMDVAQVRALCEWAEKGSGTSPLEPANYNAPGQIVISGRASVLQWAQSNYSAEAFAGAPSRAKFIPLKVSAPFHCSMMKPAEETMREVLKEVTFSRPQFPIVQNVTAEAETQPEKLRDNLVRQVSSAVRWVECVQALARTGAKQCIEFGSGRVLAGLVKKIDSESLSTFNINSLEELKAVEQVLHV